MTNRLRPPAALVLVALMGLIGVGCGSNAASGTSSAGTASTARQKAVKFAQCMRDEGVSGFPDPDASGELTIDGVLNGSSLDSSSPAWKQALRTCKHLQPPGFMGDQHVTAAEQQLRLKFAQCMRENGVKDFPDPAKGDPLVDTRRIPSAATDGGMSVINAAMHTCGAAAEAAMGK
jgi:hypothetical protein